jgi:hypothetical protein
MLHRQEATGGEDRIGGGIEAGLRLDPADARVENVLFGVEHVERGARAERCLLPHAFEGQLGRGDLLIRGLDLGVGDAQLRPGVAHDLHVDARLLIERGAHRGGLRQRLTLLRGKLPAAIDRLAQRQADRRALPLAAGFGAWKVLDTLPSSEMVGR